MASSHPQSTQFLHKLPAEIVLSIADALSVEDLSRLVRSCRRLASLLQPRLYRLATTYTFEAQGRRKSPLTWAAEHGILSTVQRLLDAGADVTTTAGGFTAFYQALRNGHTDVVRVLLKAGADPLPSTSNGGIPLVLAVQHGDEELLRLLLEVTPTNATGERANYEHAVARAVFHGHTRLVRFMLDNAARWLDVARNGDLIYQAASTGNCDMIRLLIGYGATVEPLHRTPRHPLVIAAQNGHKEAVQLLMALSKEKSAPTVEPVKGLEERSISTRLVDRFGTDLSQPTKDGLTPLQIALEEFSPPEVIHQLLDLGAEPSVQGRDGSTALHTLVRLKRHDLLETLIDGASLSASDSKGNTPLLLAVAVFNVSAASLFIECGADLAARDIHGRTVLHLAASHSSGVILSMLLRAGADISALDEAGRIPLHYTTFGTNLTIFRAFLSTHRTTKTDHLVRSHTGRTVLDMAAESGNLDLVRELIREGADVNSHWEGYSPLHAAVANRHPQLAELLLSHGANPLRLDYYGQTPFDLAAGDQSMLEGLARWCDIPYTRTDRDTRRGVLKESVLRFASRLSDGQKGDSYKLAKCLVYLKDEEAALAAFRQAAKIRACEDDLRYPMCCGGCRKRLNAPRVSEAVVLVCRRCHELDFSDPSSFLGFYSTDAGFATPSTSDERGNDELWNEQLEQIVIKYS
ncbi:ankyrin repeat-containing domain protein [Aspergillus spinulosporus]